MPSILTRSVTQADDDDTWTFTCPGVVKSPCGARDGTAPFTSSGWPTRKIAEARGREHFDEHKGIAVASELSDFRAAHGLTVAPDGAVVKVEDL